MGETGPISSTDWKKHDFEFNVKKGNHRYILFEASYRANSFFPYNGNILIDNASSIKECTEDVPVPTPPIAKAKPKPKKPTPEPVVTAAPKPEKVFKPTVVKALARPAVAGRVIKLGSEFLKFQADSSSVNNTMTVALKDIVGWMDANPGIKIEIGGHTNGIPDHEYCDYLSTKRAKICC